MNRTPTPARSGTPVANDPVGSLVGEFIEEKLKEKQEEKARLAPRRRNPLVVPLLFAVTLAIWIAPSLMPPREPVLPPDTIERSARLTLYLASLRVRDYATKNGTLPADLIQAGVDTSGLTYTRVSNSAFELTSRVQGSRMVYRSTQPDSQFLGASLRIRGIS